MVFLLVSEEKLILSSFNLLSKNNLFLPSMVTALINSNVSHSKLFKTVKRYQDVVNLANIHMSVMRGIDAASN